MPTFAWEAYSLFGDLSLALKCINLVNLIAFALSEARTLSTNATKGHSFKVPWFSREKYKGGMNLPPPSISGEKNLELTR